MFKSYVNDLKNIFFSSDLNSVEENFSVFKGKGVAYKKDAVNLDENLLLDKIVLLSEAGLVLTFTIADDVQTFYIVSNNSVDENRVVIADYLEHLDFIDENEIRFEIHIKKSETNLHIFDFDRFEAYLLGLDLQESLEKWGIYNFDSIFNVCVWHDFEKFNSKTITFESVYPKVRSCEDRSNDILNVRESIFSNRDKFSHFLNADKIKLIPEDFIVPINCSRPKIKKIFDAMSNSLVISFLSDYSSINENFLTYRMKGYKLLSGKVSYENLKNSNENELYDIYSWVYFEGNFSDKIGLARNVISLHLIGDCILSVANGTSDSVRSGYDLYLKENVKQYIEIKNKINEFLYGQSDKALDLTKSVFSTVKAGIWTFMTFFVTVFLLRAISGKSLGGTISYEVLVVAFLLVIISSIYFGVSIFEINVDKKRLLERYAEVRNRYKDLLNESDLNKIINVDLVSKKESTYIDRKRNLYCFVWFLICAFTLITVCWLYKSTNEAVAPLPANTNIESEEIILNLNNAHINFGLEKGNSFLTSPKS